MEGLWDLKFVESKLNIVVGNGRVICDCHSRLENLSTLSLGTLALSFKGKVIINLQSAQKY